jgi:hypothetical protein
MSGAIHPLPNTPSWGGAQFKERKHGDNFTLLRSILAISKNIVSKVYRSQ